MPLKICETDWPVFRKSGLFFPEGWPIFSVHVADSARNLQEAAFLSMDSLVLLEQIRTIDKRRVIRYLGSVGGRDMEGVNRVLSFSIGL